MASAPARPTKLPAFCSLVSLTGSGRPVLFPSEVETAIFDDAGVEFQSGDSAGPGGPEGAGDGVRGGILTLTTHRIIWVPNQSLAATAADHQLAGHQLAFDIPLSLVASARQQKKSVKQMFASPRVVLSLQIPLPQKQKTHPTHPEGAGPGGNQGPSTNPLFQSPLTSAPRASQQRYSHCELTLVFRGQSGPDTFLKKYPEVAILKKWEVAPPPTPQSQPQPQGAAGVPASSPAAAPFSPASAGVGGILRREQEKMQHTEQGLKEAFTDLNALMAKASEMVQLAERMRTFMQKAEAARNQPTSGDSTSAPSTSDATSAAATAAGFSSAQEMQDWLLSVGISSPVTKESAGALFHQELSRQLADFVEAPLKRSGGMLSLVDVYCLFNRARGTELISPDDLLKACCLWGTAFHPPVSLRKFASGVLVVQLQSCSQEQVLSIILGLLQGPESTGTGVGAVEVASALGVGTTLAREELLNAEQQGHLCRDDGPEGLRFFRNFFRTASAA